MRSSKYQGSRQRFSRRGVIALLLALGLIATACGSDDAADEPAAEEESEEDADAEDDAAEEGDAGDEGAGNGEEAAAAGLDEVCELGAEEGSFSYWATFAEENFAQIEAVFAETYPGIDIDFLPLRAVESVQRVLTEASSDVELEVDLINGNLDALQALYDRDLVNTEIDWAALGVQEDWIHPTNMVRIYRVPLGIAYNTDLTDSSELPTTWEELIDERFRNNLVVDPRGNPFKELSLVWGAEQTIDYVERLSEIDPVVIEGGTAGMLAVVGGEYTLTAGGRDDSRAELQADGAPIDIQYLDVIPTTDFYNLLIADSAQSNAAACFAGWLMTEEGQEIHTSVEFKRNDSIPEGAPEGAELAILETSEQAEEVAAVGEEVTAIWTQ